MEILPVNINFDTDFSYTANSDDSVKTIMVERFRYPGTRNVVLKLRILPNYLFFYRNLL